jgi:hypothetical protein
MTNSEQSAIIQELIDKRAIEEALLRYCRGIDRCDEELVLSAFHDDAYDDHGSYGGPAREFAWRIVDRNRRLVEFSMHRITNHLIDVDGDIAISEAMVSSVQRIVGEARLQFSGSRYLDRFERRNGQWRIAYRLIVHDWGGSAELGAWTLPGADTTAFVSGGRGMADPIIDRSRLFRPAAKS